MIIVFICVNLKVTLKIVFCYGKNMYSRLVL
jgi:hypothetical protein